nr:MAG TPA: hypothetical protein [Caudoviricetes sp.]
MEKKHTTQSNQAKATRKYEAKVGLVSKSYKLKKEVVEAFASACEKRCVSQSGQLTAMMQAFIDEVNAAAGVNDN